jgi:hypothetical protein
VKLPEFSTKNIALSVWNGSKLTDYSFETLLAQGNEFRKSHGVGEGDAVVIAGDVRFPFTFSDGKKKEDVRILAITIIIQLNIYES